MNRILPILLLTLGLTLRAFAQEATSTAPATTTNTTTAATTTATALPAPSDAPTDPIMAERAAEERQQVREALTRLLNRHPPQVWRVLAIDSALFQDERFLSRFPELALFVKQHPEVTRNPHYYMMEFDADPRPVSRQTPLDELIETLSIIFVVALIAATLAWVIRTFLEQRRWNQLARRQSEVHTKILDRFNSSEEVLNYIKTPAGSKFLESAPIAVQMDMPRQSGPHNRVLWSIQIGVIVGFAGLGMLLTSAAFSGESAQGFFAMGVIAFSIGAGFVGSALVSMAVAKKLGPLQEPGAANSVNVVDEPGLMR
jgi:hypothetical protein